MSLSSAWQAHGGATVEVRPKCSQWAHRGGRRFEFARLPSDARMFVSPWIANIFYFSDRLLIGQSLRQTPAWCVCLCALNACVCECSGCWECRGVQPADPLISSLLCEVWPLSGRSTSAAVFLFTVIRWHMALTHRECCTSGKITCISDLLNSFFSEKPQRKNALAAHASLNVYPGTRLLRQRGGETFEDRYRSSAGVR